MLQHGEEPEEIVTISLRAPEPSSYLIIAQLQVAMIFLHLTDMNAVVWRVCRIAIYIYEGIH